MSVIDDHQIKSNQPPPDTVCLVFSLLVTLHGDFVLPHQINTTHGLTPRGRSAFFVDWLLHIVLGIDVLYSSAPHWANHSPRDRCKAPLKSKTSMVQGRFAVRARGVGRRIKLAAIRRTCTVASVPVLSLPANRSIRCIVLSRLFQPSVTLFFSFLSVSLQSIHHSIHYHIHLFK